MGRCHLHGGRTESHNKAAAEEQARAAVVTYGRPVETNAVDALLDELRWTVGHATYCRDRIQELAPDAVVWGQSRRKAEGSMAMEILADGSIDMVPTVNVETIETAGASAWVKLYLEERKHLLEVAATCARLDIDTRRVRLAEQQGQLLVAGLRWFVAGLQLSERKLALADQRMLEMLRALNAGQIPVIEGAKS